MRRREAAPFLALMALGLVVRLIDLGDRPFHHDESQDAYFSWVLYDRGDYEYQPILHGPLRFYLTAAVYVIFGDSDLTARLAPALMGTLLVGLPFFLRRLIGTPAAIAASAMLAFGPTFLYFSRFAREDIYVAAINLALLAAVFRFLDRPWRGGPALILGLTAAALATKETTYITLFVAGAFFLPALGPPVGLGAALVAAAVGLLVLEDAALTAILAGSFAVTSAGWEVARRRAGPGAPRDLGVLARAASVGWVPWGYGLAALALIFALLFTVFFTNPSGLWDGIHDSLDYWLGQQDVGRGGEPWYFYLVVLAAHEWPVLLLGAVGIVAVLARPTLLGLFLIWAFACSLAVYSWASEKFAWLAMHPLMPLIVLAGIGVQALLRARPAVVRLAAAPVLALGALYLGYASFLVNAEHRADPREFLVSTQSSEDVKTVVRRVEDVSARVEHRTGREATITIDTAEGATYPWAWYFRHRPVGYIDMTTPNYVPDAQVLIMTRASRQALLPALQAYEGRRFRFRVWWVRDWSRKLESAAWRDWLIDREPWNAVGGMPEWVYVRRDATAA